MPKTEPRPRICDYEGSNYRTEFWEGRGRDYEDRVERIALRRLLRGGGRRLLEVGAGFGRLSDEFAAFDQVVLLDYSFSQLQYAQEHHGDLNRHAGKTMLEVMTAAIKGTNQAYQEDGRPTIDLHLPTTDVATLGQFFQMFMLATIVEGRLMGINPYGQPGVEKYKQNMNRILRGG